MKEQIPYNIKSKHEILEKLEGCVWKFSIEADKKRFCLLK